MRQNQLDQDKWNHSKECKSRKLDDDDDDDEDDDNDDYDELFLWYGWPRKGV